MFMAGVNEMKQALGTNTGKGTHIAKFSEVTVCFKHILCC